MSVSNRVWWWLIPVPLITATLSIHALDSDVLWVDEFSSIADIGAIHHTLFNPSQIIDMVKTYRPQHIPAYYFVLAGWSALVGWEPFALRALSLFFGLLTVCFTYRLGRDWLSPRTGVYAAALLGTNAFFIYFAHELRMYTMLTFFVAFSLWVYRRIITMRTAPGLKMWIVLWVAAFGLLGSHVYGALIFAVLAAYHLFFVPRTRRWTGTWAVFATAVLPFVPWIQVIMRSAQGVSHTEALRADALPPASIIWWIGYLFGNGMIALVVVLAIFAVVGLRIYHRATREVWFLTIAAFIFTLMANAFVPMITVRRVRYLVHLWPLLALLAGVGLTNITRLTGQGAASIIMTGLVITGIGNTFNAGFLEDMDGPLHVQQSIPMPQIMRTLTHFAHPDDMIVLISQQNRIFVASEFGPSIAEYYLSNYDYLEQKPIELPGWRTHDEVRQYLLDDGSLNLNAWFAYESDIAPETLAEYRDILAERYTFCGSAFDSPEYRIDRYDLATFGCIEQHTDAPPVATFENNIT
ncbi:MAG: glycosyltransferase family 39 protein, partial [Anaerolineae bacterium]|nr:glycosyltransferase family 39 protein [Anaerolineae bacterium]